MSDKLDEFVKNIKNKENESDIKRNNRRIKHVHEVDVLFKKVEEWLSSNESVRICRKDSHFHDLKDLRLIFDNIAENGEIILSPVIDDYHNNNQYVVNMRRIRNSQTISFICNRGIWEIKEDKSFRQKELDKESFIDFVESLLRFP